MKVCIETITPDIAREYLTKNTNNYRPVIRSVVGKYAADIKSGLFEENGNAIVFSKTGVLLDGQHRLYAIVEADKPVTMVVVRDVEETCQTFDYQSKRTDVQILRASGIDGYARSPQAISAAAMLISGCIYAGDRRAKETSVQLKRKFLEKNKTDVDAVASACFNGDSNKITKKAPVFCASWCLFVSGEPCERLEKFFRVVNTGFPVDGEECTPCIVLRNYLISNRGTPSSYARHYGEFCNTIRAYLDFKNKVQRKVIYKWTPVVDSYFSFASMKAREDIA